MKVTTRRYRVPVRFETVDTDELMARYLEAEKKWAERLAPMVEANRQSEILSAADYQVTINCKGK